MKRRFAQLLGEEAAVKVGATIRHRSFGEGVVRAI